MKCYVNMENPITNLTEETIEKQFCKHYCNINSGEASNFDERMQFDIYKRATKGKR